MKHIRIKTDQLPLHLMILPAVILVFIYSYIPMFGMVMSFQNFDPALGFFKSDWAGLANFRYLFTINDLKQVIWNTVFISIMKILFETLAAIALALLLNELKNVFFKMSIQTIIYFPHFLSWIILGGIFREILSYSGLLNNFLASLNIKPILFLGNNQVFPFVLIATYVWQQAGFSLIIYLAAIQGINPSLYEAAEIDGANRWYQTIHITLPGIKSIIILMATLNLRSLLNAGFSQVYSLYSPIVYKSGDIIDTWVYRMGLLDSQYSISASVDLLKSFICFLLISMSYYLAYKLSDYRIF